MGLFEIFKKKDTEDVNKLELFAPIKGKYIPLNEIQDEVFSQGILGEGCGIIPIEGSVYSPVDGEITLIADTRHAIGVRAINGVEILIHVGMDTVEMNGEGFEIQTSVGKEVRKGELLISFNIKKIQSAGYPIDTAFIVTEKGKYCSLTVITDEDYNVLDYIGRLDN